MLHPIPLTAYSFRYDNWGTNPSATPGTSVVPGTSNAEGSWTQVASGADIAQDCYWLHLQVSGIALTAVAKNVLLDIGVDPAGGTSYSAIISNLDVGSAPALTAAGGQFYLFPFFIPANSTVAIRAQGSHTTPGTLRAMVAFWGQPARPELAPRGAISQTFGTITNSNGNDITPGNAADGSWTDLGALTSPLWWWQLGHGINNGTVTAEYTYFEVAFGDVSNKHSIFRYMHVGTTGETVGTQMPTHLAACAAFQPVPAGSNIYVRARCLNAPDTGYHCTVVGIGG